MVGNKKKRPCRLTVKTPLFQGEDRGSIPLRAILLIFILTPLLFSQEANPILRYYNYRFQKVIKIEEKYHIPRSKRYILGKIFDYSLIYLYQYFRDEAFEISVRLIYTESRFDPHAESNKGALGLGQLKRETAEFVAKEILKYKSYNIFNIDENLRISFAFLASLLEFSQSPREALARYYSGKKFTQYIHSNYVNFILLGRSNF